LKTRTLAQIPATTPVGGFFPVLSDLCPTRANVALTAPLPKASLVLGRAIFSFTTQTAVPATGEQGTGAHRMAPDPACGLTVRARAFSLPRGA